MLIRILDDILLPVVVSEDGANAAIESHEHPAPCYFWQQLLCALDLEDSIAETKR
jgi:hypothetical protein